MSSEPAPEQPDPSRQTNLNKCGNPGSDANTSEPDSTSSDVPDSDDVFWSVVEELWDLADLPVATLDGTPIREDYAEKAFESWESDVLYQCDQCGSAGEHATFQPRVQSPEEHVRDAHGHVLEATGLSPADAAEAWVQRHSVTGEHVTDVDAISWIEAIAELLDSHEKTRKTTINLQYGWPQDEDYSTYSFSATDRWSPDYQQEFYAECQGWLRELTGGERPSGGDTPATYDNPSVAFLTRSASSMPDDERLGPVDHAVNLRNPWREVYQSIRYELEKQGFEKDDYQYWRVLEPHPGDGLNRCYAHEHVILVIDGEVPHSVFRPVMETHVAATDGAGLDAHTNTPCPEHADGDPWNDAEGECEDCDTPVSVRDPETVENLAAYVADYASIDPLDLFERSPEYIAWAAAMTAGNVRSVSRSDPAGWAATADRCKQMHESSKSDLEGSHGDRLTTSNKGANRLECAECGSPHGIDQTQSLGKHRLQQEDGADTVVADGGSTDLWDDWVAAWKAGRKRTADRECRHPDNSNQCPLCAEYEGAVDSTVPIPDHAYLPESAFENAMCDHVERIEREISRYPEATVPMLLGRLRDDLPVDHAEALVRGVLAGFEPPDPEDYEPDKEYHTRQRVPEWHVKSITIDGEEHAASAGNGVTMLEVSTTEESWATNRTSEGGTESWRSDPWNDPNCNECESGVYERMTPLDDAGSYKFSFVCDSCKHEIPC